LSQWNYFSMTRMEKKLSKTITKFLFFNKNNLKK
jgi:hypothetical protein